MKRHGLLVAFAVGLLPAVAQAQILKEQDLAGALWERRYFDSTGTAMPWPRRATSVDTIRFAAPSDTTWHLVGDTLMEYYKRKLRRVIANKDEQQKFMSTRDPNAQWQVIGDTVVLVNEPLRTTKYLITEEKDQEFLVTYIDPTTGKPPQEPNVGRWLMRRYIPPQPKKR
jgi:hypothetical protein